MLPCPAHTRKRICQVVTNSRAFGQYLGLVACRLHAVYQTFAENVVNLAFCLLAVLSRVLFGVTQYSCMCLSARLLSIHLYIMIGAPSNRQKMTKHRSSFMFCCMGKSSYNLTWHRGSVANQTRMGPERTSSAEAPNAFHTPIQATIFSSLLIAPNH